MLKCKAVILLYLCSTPLQPTFTSSPHFWCTYSYPGGKVHARKVKAKIITRKMLWKIFVLVRKRMPTALPSPFSHLPRAPVKTICQACVSNSQLLLWLLLPWDRVCLAFYLITGKLTFWKCWKCASNGCQLTRKTTRHQAPGTKDLANPCCEKL